MPEGRLLLIVPTTSYTTDAFLEACRSVGVEALIATDRCHVLDERYEFPEDSLVIDFYEPERSVETIVEAARRFAIRGVVPGSGEAAALLSAMVAERLRLPANSVAAAEAARNKRRMRELLAAAGVPSPRFVVATIDDDPARAAAAAGETLGWPVVLKPLLLSASRGVIRADDPDGFAAAFARVRRLLLTPELLELDATASRQILVEAFVPGVEVALEGLLEAAELRTLAIFDKPDPLDGPFFEETIYVTPSRHPAATQDAIRRTVAAGARAMGLKEGPVHAELRLAPDGPVVIEIAARSIGGLCSRMLRFGTGLSLEEVLVRHALGLEVARIERERAAAGAMMIPIPRAGVLKEVAGVEAARAVPGIQEVAITARVGEELVPLPEGAAYLGFLFARGERPDEVEAALRAAHRELRFTIAPTLPVG